MVKLILKHLKYKVFKIKYIFIIFFLYIKMLTWYYKKNKERLSNKAPEKYESLSKEEKDKRCQYASKQCRNLS